MPRRMYCAPSPVWTTPSTRWPHKTCGGRHSLDLWPVALMPVPRSPTPPALQAISLVVDPVASGLTLLRSTPLCWVGQPLVLLPLVPPLGSDGHRLFQVAHGPALPLGPLRSLPPWRSRLALTLSTQAVHWAAGTPIKAEASRPTWRPCMPTIPALKLSSSVSARRRPCWAALVRSRTRGRLRPLVAKAHWAVNSL